MSVQALYCANCWFGENNFQYQPRYYTYGISWALPPTTADYYEHGQQLCLQSINILQALEELKLQQQVNIECSPLQSLP